MEPFKIICVTCQAKLAVNNASLIGQIVACPRCESMVEITPPIGEAASAATKPVPVVEEVAPAVTATVVVPEEVVVPNAEAEILQASAEVAKYKMMVWSLAGVLVGAFLLGGVWYSRSDSNTETTVRVSGNLNPATTHEVNTPPTVETPVANPAPIVETPPAVTPNIEIAVPAVEEPAAEVVEQPEPAAPIVEQPTEAPEATPKIARRFDPLDFDPESLTLAAVDQPPEPVEPLVLEPQDEVTEAPDEVPSTLPLVRRGPDGSEETSERDAEKQLALSIPSLKFHQMPLIDCLRLVSQLGGVPVSVSPKQLLLAGITSQKKVAFDQAGISLGDMLKQVLEPLHLEYAIQGAQVLITRQEAKKQREINYPINDLLDDATSADTLAGWVEQLVAPPTWKSAGGEGTLKVSPDKLRIAQTQQVQYQVLIFLERLRLARNLPPRSRYPVKRLAGTPASMLLQEKLERSATFTFSQYTPIDDIFVHWQTELGVPLLVDWPALEVAELCPTTTITCAINSQPWSIAFEKILEPLGLGWRATLSGAIEITAAEKVQTELQLEIYPLRSDFEGGIDQLRLLAKSQPGGVMLYDPSGKVLIALQPATAHREISRALRQQGLFLNR